MELEISGRDMDALAAHAESKKPLESCAVLLGRGGRVTRVELADNAAGSETEFAIPDGQLAGIYADAERRGEDVVGIFHSHPASEAYPSDTDVRYMRTNPVPWLIYSGLDGTFGAYALGPGITRVQITRATN